MTASYPQVLFVLCRATMSHTVALRVTCSIITMNTHALSFHFDSYPHTPSCCPK